MTFVSKWIADKEDRGARKATIKAILDAVQTESEINSSGWTDAYMIGKMKKLAAKQRKKA